MDLPYIWFLIVGFLFIGYFVLDGFDFGVGMSLPFLSKDDTDRRVLINTIGPVWDMNETWLIVAGAVMFAAFPEWYASLFSGFYLALLIILIALILRGVSFEYRHQNKGRQWTKWFDRAIVVGSTLPAFLWGVAFANLVQGVPMDEDNNFIGSFVSLLGGYALLGGLTTLMLFFTHGVIFVALKTEGELRERARALAGKTVIVTIVVAALFLGWTVLQHVDAPHILVIVALAALAAASLVAAWVSNTAGREGRAFAAMVSTILFAVATILSALFPNVMPASNVAANGLSIESAASGSYTLTIMTWLICFSLPFILGYQAWTYWVFRKRITRATVLASSH
jgi:cytochrome d ubiquinol oxidase subunit II